MSTTESATALKDALQTLAFCSSGPACWGPMQWLAMHQIARGYPRQAPTDAQQVAWTSYVSALADLLPCPVCADHWRAIILRGVPTASRFDVLKWTIDVHNEVNARLHKPTLSYEQAVKAMQQACPGNVFRGARGSSSTRDSSPQLSTAAWVGLALAAAAVGALIAGLAVGFSHGRTNTTARKSVV
jgi:hypothetical protein